MRRKKERSKVKQTNKAKQHSTPKAVTFPRKNELPQVGLEPTTLYTLDRALYQLSYRGSSAGWAQISHLIVHLMNRLTINSTCTCIYSYILHLREPTTLYTLDRALYQLSYRGSSAGWAQISHLIVHLMNRLTINSTCTCTCMYSYILHLIHFFCACKGNPTE